MKKYKTAVTYLVNELRWTIIDGGLRFRQPDFHISYVLICANKIVRCLLHKLWTIIDFRSQKKNSSNEFLHKTWFNKALFAYYFRKSLS